MNRKQPIGRTASALMIAVGIGVALPAAAQSAPPPRDEWAFRATVYGWFPGLSGTTEFPSGAGGPSIEVNADTLIESLKMAFMGTFEAQYGRWGGLIDWFYSDVGGDKAGTRDFVIRGQPLAAGVNANLSLDVKTNIVTLAGTYALVEKPEYSMGSVVGARVLSMDQTLNWAFNGTGPLGIARSGTAEVSATNWDAIIGVRGRARFGGDLRWFVPYYADIGTGNSKLTWQALAGLGYSFGWGEVMAAWRYLDYEFKSGEPLQSMTFNGVAVGVSFRF
jgi:hypothetical protein